MTKDRQQVEAEKRYYIFSSAGFCDYNKWEESPRIDLFKSCCQSVDVSTSNDRKKIEVGKSVSIRFRQVGTKFRINIPLLNYCNSCALLSLPSLVFKTL